MLGRKYGIYDSGVENNVFADDCARILEQLKSTKKLVQDLKAYGRSKYSISYPIESLGSRLFSFGNDATRSNSVIGVDGEDQFGRSETRERRASSVIGVQDDSEIYLAENGGRLKVLRVDLRQPQGTDIMGSLEQASMSRLLDESFEKSERHLEKLQQRVADKSSKILVTGDLNAGKSTLVNALIRRNVLPSDQQPCTMVFCEVLDASKNKGREEIHGVFDLDRYDPQNPATYHVIAQDELEDTVLDNVNMYQQLKIFTRDNVDKQDSLLSNGVVDISLIDSPGLNRDSLKTTQLFARQEEIDVVVFVVNAENHFTLSGQEFLASAGKEKAHIFTVVNRFDAIKRKDKCRRMIMDQIKELSAETYDEAENLVHFVSAKNLVVDGSAKPSPEFALMEKKLRWWTLGQRFKSKLAPAQRYMLNLLSDLYLISAENIELAAKKIQEINSVLRSDMPKYENLLDKRANAVKSIESMVEESQEKVRTYTADFLSTSIGNLDAAGDSVEWPGLFNCYYYAENVFLSNVNYLYSQISESENFARFVINSSANSLVSLDQQRRSLESDPSDIPSLSSDIVDSQLASLTFSHSHSISPFLDAFSIQLSDFIDLEKFKFKLPTSITLTASSFVVLSNSTLLSNFVTLFRFSSNYIPLSPNSSSSVSKFVLFSAGCIGLGSILYMLYEVDHTIKHNISSRLKAGLHAEKFADTHANRLATETCRAISPFAWRLQNSFQRMVEAEELKRADHLRSRHLSQDAQIYFDDLKTRVFELVSSIRSVNSSAKFI